MVDAAIDRISRRYSRITFDVLSADAATLVERELKSRNIELFVAARLDSLSSEDFQVDILHDDPLIIAADARHPLTRRRSLKLAELSNEPWVWPPANTISGAYMRNAFQENGMTLPATIVSTYSAVLQHYLVG